MTSTTPLLPADARAPRPPAPVLLVAGGPSSFLRISALATALRAIGQPTIVVHSGRPDAGPSLTAALTHAGGVPADICLDLDAPTPGALAGSVLVEMERVLLETAPALVVVAGGLDSALGCALAAAKLGIHVAHLDAGLRSFDWSTTDEINRTLIDRLAKTMLTSSIEAGDNLSAEGVASQSVHHVGSTLVDVVLACEQPARALRMWEQVGQVEGRYVLVSLHRPEHVALETRSTDIGQAIAALARRHPVVLSLDEASRASAAGTGVLAELDDAGVRMVDRVDYLSFLSLIAGAGAVLTDAGAIQDETSALGIPCFTLRNATDRPVTLGHGTNMLLGDDDVPNLELVAPGIGARCAAPFWDGRAAQRAAERVVAITAAREATRA